MRWRRLTYIALTLTLVLSNVQVFESAQRNGRNRARRQQERSRRLLLYDFAQNLPKFAESISALEEALSSRSNVEKPAKAIDKQLAAFVRYVKFLNAQHPSFDASAFRGYSIEELQWEMLTSAEKLNPQLQKVIEAEFSDVIDRRYWDFLYQLESDLLRLKWLASRVK